jgi:hypothetical protein
MLLRPLVRTKGGGVKKAKSISIVSGKKTCFIGNKVAKIGRGTRSTGEARSRMNFVERAQSVQATRKARVWANTAQRPEMVISMGGAVGGRV